MNTVAITAELEIAKVNLKNSTDKFDVHFYKTVIKNLEYRLSNGE